MYKIQYLATGHIFVLPDDTAKELKEKYPDDYKIIEKNGKKFQDKKRVKQQIQNSIRDKITEE